MPNQITKNEYMTSRAALRRKGREEKRELEEVLIEVELSFYN
jgi:hypothetical protein